MTRKEITKALTDILLWSKMGDRKYYAKEVTLDYGTSHPKRVDVMQFMPKGVVYASDMEKGIFICYEIKSCIEDVYSGHGLNFYGEKNYIVTTMETFKKLQPDIRSGKLADYLCAKYPESSKNFGILVAIPETVDLRNTDSIYAEYEDPTPFTDFCNNGKLWTAIPCRGGSRKRSTTELLFCMLRSKHNQTNMSVTQG